MTATNGTAPLSYQWHKNGVDIGGATANAYTTPATSASDNGAIFNVTVTNSAGNVTSADATLTVSSNYSVSGNVNWLSGGTGGMSGVTLSINTNPVQTTTTDSSGDYTLKQHSQRELHGPPSFSGATSSVFSPSSLPVTVSGAQPKATCTSRARWLTASPVP